MWLKLFIERVVAIFATAPALPEIKTEKPMSSTEAVEWNRSRHSKADTIKIQKAVGATPDGVWGPATILEIMNWQEAHKLKPDGKVGSQTLSAMLSNVEQEVRDLTDSEVDKIIERTVQVEAGYTGNPYAAMNLDAEFEGWFDRPKVDQDGNRLKPAERAKQPDHAPHKASKYHSNGGIHIGLSWGIIQFTQDGGSLGNVLRRAVEIDSASFNKVFGPDANELLVTLSKNGKSGLQSVTLRGPRVQPVGGEDIWKGKWLDRWREASAMECFRRAQRDEARAGYFVPAVGIAKDAGLNGQGDIAVAFDMCVQYGAGGTRKYFKKAKDKFLNPSIHDVISCISSKRGRERREEILAASEVWVQYRDLYLNAVDT
jgi:hypothetical protein